MDWKILTVTTLLASILAGCKDGHRERSMTVMDPGHFHAALIQKNPVPGVSETVKVFAPDGDEVKAYLATIESFNTREDNPTSWTEDVYIGEDFLEKLPMAGKGDFMVLAGNNMKKARYMADAVEKGYSVLADKPLAITDEDFVLLESAVASARAKGLQVLDMMTERHDILNIIARALVHDNGFFGKIDSLRFRSVHHFYKDVAGTALKRPVWYYDVSQQGEGLADVTTHLVDLAFWTCFPDEGITEEDVVLCNATHHPTSLTLEQFRKSTLADSFPGFLASKVKDGVLQVMANGEMDFRVRGIPVSIGVEWEYEAPAGGDDTSEYIFKGSKATVRIVQDESTGFSKKLLIQAPEEAAKRAEAGLEDRFPYVALAPFSEGTWSIEVPTGNRPGHEDHFGMVVTAFLEGNIQEWEYSNLLTKYRLTTAAVDMACKQDTKG